METQIRRAIVPGNFSVANILYDVLFNRQGVWRAERNVKSKNEMKITAPKNPAAGYNLGWRRDA